MVNHGKMGKNRLKMPLARGYPKSSILLEEPGFRRKASRTLSATFDTPQPVIPTIPPVIPNYPLAPFDRLRAGSERSRMGKRRDPIESTTAAPMYRGKS